MATSTAVDVDTTTFAEVIGAEDWAIACALYPQDACLAAAVAYLTLLPCGCTAPCCAGHARRFAAHWPPRYGLILVCDDHHIITTNYRLTPIKERS